MAESTLSEHRVLVVGGGIGGLVSALLLAQRGLALTLVVPLLNPWDPAARPGGRGAR